MNLSQKLSQNIPQFSVAEFSKIIKGTIENAFGYVKITGEITGFKMASSGHLYFNLREGNSLLTAVCFRNQAKNINFEIGDGLEICASGQITTFEGRSNYQIIIDKIEIAGIGAILEMIAKRRHKLANEGLFDEKYKKPLPFFPKIVGVITSETGAVIEDIKHRIMDRCPLHLLIYPSLMQGERAPFEIISGINYFNSLRKNRPNHCPEVIIIARGGGSFEDLLPFNDEQLVRAVFKSEIPIVSAIGHETDFTLIDFVADVRAPTPTASAEFITPVLFDLKTKVKNLERDIKKARDDYFQNKVNAVKNLEKNIINPQKYLENIETKLKSCAEKMIYFTSSCLEKQSFRVQKIQINQNFILEKIHNHQQKIFYNFASIIKNIDNNFMQKKIIIEGLANAIKSCNYQQMLARGFAVIKNNRGALIASCADLKNHTRFIVEMADGKVEASIDNSKINSKKIIPNGNCQEINVKNTENNQFNLFDKPI